MGDRIQGEAATAQLAPASPTAATESPTQLSPAPVSHLVRPQNPTLVVSPEASPPSPAQSHLGRLLGVTTNPPCLAETWKCSGLSWPLGPCCLGSFPRYGASLDGSTILPSVGSCGELRLSST